MKAIADDLAVTWGDDPEAAFMRVRRVCLALVRSGICVPRNALE
jgi:hypothetical protein